jgi:ketosteroid isomerase-like protein
MSSTAHAFSELPGWVRSFMDAVNAHDAAAVAEHMTEDVVYVDMGIAERFEGSAAVRDFYADLETTFSSDYHMDFSRALIDGDSYAVEWTLSGTNDGDDPGHGLPATASRSPASRSASCATAGSPSTRTTTTSPASSCRWV